MLCILFVCLKLFKCLLIILLHHWDVLTACVLGCCEGSALHYYTIVEELPLFIKITSYHISLQELLHYVDSVLCQYKLKQSEELVEGILLVCTVHE